MRAKVLVFILSSCFSLGCVISPEARQAKIHCSDLEPMLNKGRSSELCSLYYIAFLQSLYFISIN